MKPLIALALTLTTCGPGADRAPKKAEDITALLKERDSAVASQVSESVVAVVAERDRLRIQVRELTARLDRIEARLKKLEGTQPDGPYLPIPDLPCDALDMVYNSEKGWECGKPHDGEVRSNGRCDETAGQEIYSATLGQWVCMTPSLDIGQALGDVGMKAGIAIRTPARDYYRYRLCGENPDCTAHRFSAATIWRHEGPALKGVSCSDHFLAFSDGMKQIVPSYTDCTHGEDGIVAQRIELHWPTATAGWLRVVTIPKGGKQ